MERGGQAEAGGDHGPAVLITTYTKLWRGREKEKYREGEWQGGREVGERHRGRNGRHRKK